MTEHPDLIAQINKLRKDLVLSKCIGAFFIALGVAGGTWISFHKPATLEASRLVLRDDSGKVLATLGREKFGDTCFALHTKSDAGDASLCVDDGGDSALFLGANGGTSRTVLSNEMEGHAGGGGPSSMLYIGEENGKNYVNLSLDEGGSLRFGHGVDQSIVVSANKTMPAINLYGSSGKIIWSVPKN